MISGIRKYRIQAYLPDNSVVTMFDISAIRIAGHQNFRPICPDQADNFLTEIFGIFKALVRMVQKNGFLNAKHLGRGSLFLFPDLRQSSRCQSRVTCPFFTAGTDNDYHFLSLSGPSGDSSPCTDFSVIRMWTYNQYVRIVFHKHNSSKKKGF